MALDSSRRRDFLILAAERQERERQIGADCSQGYFMSDATDMGQYNGDRSFQMVIRTGEDVQSRQMLRDASPLGAVVNNGHLYVIILGLWVNAKPITANTVYHIVATFNKATMRVKLYVAGAFVSESNPRETEATYSSYFSIGNNRSDNNPIYPFQGAIMLNRDFNYELTAEEVISLDNNGDPAGYVLPVLYKYKVADYISDFSKNTDGWFAPAGFSGTSINAEGGVLLVSGDTATLRLQNNTMSYGDNPSIFRVHITFAMPFTGSDVQVFAHSSLDYTFLTLSPDKLNADGIAYLKKNGSTKNTSHIYLLGTQVGDVVKISTITIESIGVIAEYLPQNISPCPNNPANTRRFMSPMSADKWVLFQDGTPEISDGAIKCYFLAPGNNYKGGIACNLSPDQPFFTTNSFVTLTFKAKCDIDGQEIIAGLGRGRGYIYVNHRIELKTEWVEYSLSAKSLASYEGGLNTIVLYPVYNQGGIGAYYIKDVQVVEEPGIAHAWLDSTKQLPLNDEYLAPLLESINSYNLAGVNTPMINYKPTMIVDWSMLVPMSLDGLAVYPGGTVPPAIVDGALRITSNEKKESYGGGGRYLNVVNATPGDTVEWDFEIRASGITEAMTCLSVGGSLYYTKATSTTPEWQRCSYVTPITTNPATDFWISKAYNDTTAGYIEVRNITIKTYRK